MPPKYLEYIINRREVHIVIDRDWSNLSPKTVIIGSKYEFNFINDTFYALKCLYEISLFDFNFSPFHKIGLKQILWANSDSKALGRIYTIRNK